MFNSLYMPTKVLIGNNLINDNPLILNNFGKKAFIVTGKNSARLSGALSDVISSLNKCKIEYTIFDKIMPNPTIDIVYLGAKLLKESNCDFIIAIGGGSPMDASKAISMLATNDIKREEIFIKRELNEILPLILIPTTSGTGSEVTPYSILTDDLENTKTSISNEKFFPKLSILDGKYTINLNKTITINTALDALSHAVESYLSKRTNSVSELYSLEAIRLIGEELDNLINFNLDLNSRNKLLYASSLAGIAIAHTSTVVVHVMGYPLTYFKNIDHGRANGLILMEYLKLVEKEFKDRINSILKVINLPNLSILEEKINILLGQKEKISEEEIYKFSTNSLKKKNISNSIINIEEKDIIKMYFNVFMR